MREELPRVDFIAGPERSLLNGRNLPPMLSLPLHPIVKIPSNVCVINKIQKVHPYYYNEHKYVHYPPTNTTTAMREFPTTERSPLILAPSQQPSLPSVQRPSPCHV